jgi:hypothetical protein
MKNSIDRYLAELRQALKGADRALIQEALADAEEYLWTAIDRPENAGKADEEAAFEQIIEKYGSPQEVAAAYLENESRIVHAYTPPLDQEQQETEQPRPAPDTRPLPVKFFGVFADARAWGALLYLVFALGTGIAYFTWAVTGLSVSAGMLVLIIGIPILLLFLLSVRGIALVEGRIVEALLGVRMPHRALFSRSDLGFMDKLKNMLTQRQTWTSFAYMVLQLPFGIVYFTCIAVLLSLSVWLIGRPLFELAFNLPAYMDWGYAYYTPGWLMPFSVIGGFLLLTASLHLIKMTGKLHGLWAKTMLVRE